MWLRIVMALLLAVFLASPGAARETIRLTNGEFAPFQSKKLKHYGLLSRIVTEAFALEGVDVEYGFFPWKRAYELAQNGKWDGTFAWQKNEERAEWFLFSDRLYTTRQAFFHPQANKFDWEDYDDLAQYTFGATLGYTYGAEFDRRARDGELDVQKVATDELNLNKLAMGRIDAFPCNVEIGYYLLRTRFSPGVADLITHHPHFLTDEAGLHVLISRKCEKGEHFIEAFNRGLGRLRESGMYDKYILESRRGAYLN